MYWSSCGTTAIIGSENWRSSTSIDLSTLSRLLVTMQRNGLIVRRQIRPRRPRAQLDAHPRGMELTERIVPHALHYEDVAMRRLSERDVLKLKNF